MSDSTSTVNVVSQGSTIKFGDPICLILDGKVTHIPDPATYDRLFAKTNVMTNVSLNTKFTASLTNDAFLAKDENNPIYLVSNGVKRWIVSPAVFDHYGFAWDKVQVIPTAKLNSIPTGPHIENVGGFDPAILGNGQVVRIGIAICQIIDHVLFHIPNPETLKNIYSEPLSMIQMLSSAPIIHEMSNGAVLARGGNTPAVYLVSNGVKRHVTSPDVMKSYQYDFAKVVSALPILIDSIPNGMDINN